MVRKKNRKCFRRKTVDSSTQTMPSIEVFNVKTETTPETTPDVCSVGPSRKRSRLAINSLFSKKSAKITDSIFGSEPELESAEEGKEMVVPISFATTICERCTGKSAVCSDCDSDFENECSAFSQSVTASTLGRFPKPRRTKSSATVETGSDNLTPAQLPETTETVQQTLAPVVWSSDTDSSGDFIPHPPRRRVVIKRRRTKNVPSRVPFEVPSEVPSQVISKVPSRVTSEVPSRLPSKVISQVPSEVPTRVPSKVPSRLPSKVPSRVPSQVPSEVPSRLPSKVPSQVISKVPSRVPSEVTSRVPSKVPSRVPSEVPSRVPSKVPSRVPSRVLSPVHKPVVLKSGRISKPTVLWEDMDELRCTRRKIETYRELLFDAMITKKSFLLLCNPSPQHGDTAVVHRRGKEDKQATPDSPQEDVRQGRQSSRRHSRRCQTSYRRNGPRGRGRP